MPEQIQFNEDVPMKWLAPMFLCVLTACSAEPGTAAQKSREVADDVLLIGKIQHPRITESSGIVVSRKNPEVFWTHNDGGGKRQVLYAMSRTGQPLAEFRIAGAVLEDWEDIAADDKGNLFVGDIGNNDSKRRSIAVHQLPEPDTKDANGLARVSRTWVLRYPQTPFDSEGLFVWGESGYLISKVVNDERADIYRFSLTNAAPFQTLEVVAEVKIDSPVTGADISRDGKLLGMVAKNGAYVFRINGDVTRAAKGKPFQAKFKHEHIEACTFVPEGLLATAESREIYLFTDEAFRTGPPKKK
ncbi:MAG TPA: hypothetical protein VGF13_09010 [Verrucomicrobiae bacterium]|jgi:hypothetical protein